jgi:hypothetical protein
VESGRCTRHLVQYKSRYHVVKKDHGRRNSGDREFVFTVSLGHECTERTRRYLGGQLAAGLGSSISPPISCHVMFHPEFKV